VCVGGGVSTNISVIIFPIELIFDHHTAPKKHNYTDLCWAVATVWYLNAIHGVDIVHAVDDDASQLLQSVVWAHRRYRIALHHHLQRPYKQTTTTLDSY